jgi:pimeloyl-ACP methyl ester carboxylesterase
MEAADRRIPVPTGHAAAARMEAGGVDASYVEYPDEDHFLFLSQLDAVLDDVAAWME